MTAVTEEEVQPGLVVFLDTNDLRAYGGCETNAMRTPQDRAVTGPHLFLILRVDSANGRCLAVTLYSGHAGDRDRLDSTKKGGTLPEWANVDSFASWYQHWWIPVLAVVRASGGERSTPGDRCTYASGDQATLEQLARRIERNRFAFGPV